MDRINYYLFLFAIGSMPFYMILKYSIFFGTNYWYYPGIIIIYLFVYLLFKYSQGGNPLHYNRLYVLMKIIFLYYLWSGVQAVLLGSEVAGVMKRFWQHIIPLMVFFIAVEEMKNKKRILTILKFIGRLSIVISILFLIEWYKTNFLQQTSFSWSLKMYEEGLLRGLYVSRTPGSDLLANLTRQYRPGGPLLTMQNTILFVIYGFVYYFGNVLYRFYIS